MTSSVDPLRLEHGDSLDGLRIVRQPAPVGAASFSATYVGPAGWGFDAPGEEGTARLVNLLVTSAAGKYDRVALARRLDRAGATLSHDISPEAGEVTVWGPAEDWEELVGVLADVVLRPRFLPEDISRVRRQMFERQLRELTQPASRAERELLRTVFPSRHPFHTSGLGDRRSVQSLTRSRLVRFHREHYTSGGSVLVVTVPARLSAVEAAARRWFGRFTGTRRPRLLLPTLTAIAPQERTVDLPGRSQVEIRVGGPSIPHRAPEYAAAYLANEILGGRPLLARLFQRVRERSGLAYHASSHLEIMRFGGIWTAQAGTGADRWKKVVPMLEGEVARLRRQLVPQRELASVRKSTIGEIPLALESTSDAHSLAVEAAYYELPPDYWTTWPDLLRTVTPADVRHAARTAFNLDRSVTVVAGPIGAL